MKPFHSIRGTVIPLGRSDVDTDQIIPARHLKRIERTGYGQFAFEDWRADPGFVLNEARFRGAPILLAGANFGCGSSREHAPWALMDLGLEAIIAPSFADIFRSNCAKVGLLTVQISDADVQELLVRAASPEGLELSVDVRELSVTDGAEFSREFEFDPFVQECFLKGLDTIALTLQHEKDIGSFEAARPEFMPRVGEPVMSEGTCN